MRVPLANQNRGNILNEYLNNGCLFLCLLGFVLVLRVALIIIGDIILLSCAVFNQGLVFYWVNMTNYHTMAAYVSICSSMIYRWEKILLKT